MPNIIKNKQVVNDNWQIIAKDAVYNGEKHAIVPLSIWLEQSDKCELGGWLDSDDAVDQLSEINNIDVIAINFPVFTDGRGFSFARELRDLGYQGDLRAMGNFIRDQLYFLQRCGFSSFALNTDDNAEKLIAAIASMDDFTTPYQASADTAKPLFSKINN